MDTGARTITDTTFAGNAANAAGGQGAMIRITLPRAEGAARVDRVPSEDNVSVN